MKRLVPLLLALAMGLSLLSACGGPNADASPAPSAPAGTAAPSDRPSGDSTHEPSLALPTGEPSDEPPAPSVPQGPSAAPSQEPSAAPSREPATQPPASPAPVPTEEPSLAPAPSPEPTLEPDPSPSEGVDLQAFYEQIVFDDAEFAASASLFGEYLDVYYPGLSAIPARQMAVYQPMITAVVCEIALVEVENNSDVRTVIDILQARVNYQVGDEENRGGAWYPASIEGWKNDSRIVSNGNYIMLIAYSKCDEIVEAFNALF